MRFIKRESAPSKDDYHYYGNDNPFVPAGYGMPNCTTYAYGRLWENCGEVLFPLTKGFDATTWYYHAKNDSGTQYQVGQTPKLGAIACWSTVANDNPNNKGTRGHVAVVEEIYDNGDFYTSNSAWKGTEFYMKRYTKSSGYNFTGTKDYIFQGFIYPTVDFDNDDINIQEEKEQSVTDSHKFELGDKVLVLNGVATEDSYGGGSTTAEYHGKPEEGDIKYITLIAKETPRPYHLSNGSTLGDGDRGWVTSEQIQKI